MLNASRWIITNDLYASFYSVLRFIREIVNYEFQNFILTGDGVQKRLQQVHTVLNGSFNTVWEAQELSKLYTTLYSAKHDQTQSSPSFCHHRDHRRGIGPGPSTHNDSSILSPLSFHQFCDAWSWKMNGDYRWLLKPKSFDQSEIIVNDTKRRLH